MLAQNDQHDPSECRDCVGATAVHRRVGLPKVVGTLDYVTVECTTKHRHTLPALLVT